jgi:SAM-dependent methyltransferase
MRKSAVKDCLRILRHFGIDPSSAEAIDVGGTETVYLDTGFARNPLLDISPKVVFLDRGFNVEVIGTKADEVVDFLNSKSILHLRDRFDLVYCFDTLEHASNPFRFCEHLIYITKPDGYIYVATVFEWPYHPSPQDYFRFSPEGLRECFENPVNLYRDEVVVLWCDWESDRRAVALLGQRRG